MMSPLYISVDRLQCLEKICGDGELLVGQPILAAAAFQAAPSSFSQCLIMNADYRIGTK